MLLLSALLLGLASGVQIKQDSDDFNPKKLMLLIEQACMTDDQVKSFKNELLDNFPCLKGKRHSKKKEVMVAGYYHVFLGLSHDYDDFACMEEEVVMDWEEKCTEVYYEPLAYLDVDSAAYTCADVSVDSDLWSLDILDGKFDNEYFHADFEGDTGVDFIILDTGVEMTHVEFKTNEVEVLEAGIQHSEYGHGTHVAGSAAGNAVGVTTDFKIYNYPVCRYSDGSCGWEHIAGGYEAAIAHMESDSSRRYVINFSVGGSKSWLTTRDYEDWGDRIEKAGGIWVTSAGNNARDACNYSPGFSDYAITVGAYSENLEPTKRFTNYGECVDIWGPGEYVYSSYPGNTYAFASGTSMASPNIAGLVAVIVSENPGITREQVKSALVSNSFELSNCPSSYGTCRAAYQTCSPNALQRISALLKEDKP